MQVVMFCWKKVLWQPRPLWSKREQTELVENQSVLVDASPIISSIHFYKGCLWKNRLLPINKIYKRKTGHVYGKIWLPIVQHMNPHEMRYHGISNCQKLFMFTNSMQS